MNTNILKRFAQEARTKLMQQVAAKLDFVLTTDTSELREKKEQIKNLNKELEQSTKQQVVEKVAYTWFNRLMALRFMDTNDYQPLGIRVISPIDGYTLPELLSEAKQGNIPDDLHIDRQKVFDLLDGRLESQNPQNEAFKLLLVASCNQLNSILPFLFERIEDYTELLLPDDLTSEFSIVQDVINGMSTEDCQQVEIIGWLYQFYISEENDRLISSKKKYDAHELAPASQLFTPRWIVEYMVDNTLGQYWSEMNPDSSLVKDLSFYIKPSDNTPIPKREKERIEDITFLDPCAGSGHILSYAFDIFYKMYEEEGYNSSEIPSLILKNNLFGLEIDERAAQLANFVLMMKARGYYRRFLRKPVFPNVCHYRNYKTDNKFENATVIGSLINVDEKDANKINVNKESLFGQQEEHLSKQYKMLGNRYSIVVTNPPYISSSRMEGRLKQYVEKHYPDTKSDLFATFIIRCLELTRVGGLTGYMTPFVWMFISSYEKLRSSIIKQHTINNLIQLEYSGFDGATVPICTFTLRKEPIENLKGSYIRLSDFKGAVNQGPKTLEAIQNPQCGWFYTTNQKDFEKIPGSPIGYWANENLIKVFENGIVLNDLAAPKKGLATTNNNRFIRLWQEVESNNFAFNVFNVKDVVDSEAKWFPLNKGGEFRKWYGNKDYLINWFNNGNELKSAIIKRYNGGSYTKEIRNEDKYFKNCITWSALTSNQSSFRFSDFGALFDSAGSSMHPNDCHNYILGFLNTPIATNILKILNPTLNYGAGTVSNIPIIINRKLILQIEEIVTKAILNSKTELNSKETSWDFQQNELLRIKGQDLEETYDLYQQYWKNKFFQLHHNEEELNRQFIEIYGLQEELTPDVPLEEITILKEESKIENGELVFNAKEVMAQFVSYAVGCIFGRYSLDKEGLILANQGETLEDYWQKLGANPQSLAPNTFVPDDDNIIPVLEDEWFEDDIVGRFKEFLKVSFGAENFEKNLTFLEDCLGKDIRKYFVKDFYADHIKRYKKRPIYWMFSSPKGAFNVLIYMHRYTPDTVSNILNGYLREYQDKLKTSREYWVDRQVSGTATEKNKAVKEIEKIDKTLLELNEYEREVIFPLATDRISIDLDDGVLVNYNKFGKAIKTVAGLNDAKAKKKVKGFDWIDVSEIRD